MAFDVQEWHFSGRADPARESLGERNPWRALMESGKAGCGFPGTEWDYYKGFHCFGGKGRSGRLFESIVTDRRD